MFKLLSSRKFSYLLSEESYFSILKRVIIHNIFYGEVKKIILEFSTKYCSWTSSLQAFVKYVL